MCVYNVILYSSHLMSVQSQVWAGSCLLVYLLWQVALGIRLTFGTKVWASLVELQMKVCVHWTSMTQVSTAHFQASIITKEHKVVSQFPNTYKVFLRVDQVVRKDSSLGWEYAWACVRQLNHLLLYCVAVSSFFTRISTLNKKVFSCAMLICHNVICTNRFSTISSCNTC